MKERQDSIDHLCTLSFLGAQVKKPSPAYKFLFLSIHSPSLYADTGNDIKLANTASAQSMLVILWII